jgi:hypothetical protein
MRAINGGSPAELNSKMNSSHHSEAPRTCGETWWAMVWHGCGEGRRSGWRRGKTACGAGKVVI